MASGNIAKNWMVRIGNLVEESIAKGIYELGQEAPILVGEPAEKVWYQVPVPEGKCGDGSDYHIYVRKGTGDKLCVFFSGGGIAINEYMAARPTPIVTNTSMTNPIGSTYASDQPCHPVSVSIRMQTAIAKYVSTNNVLIRLFR